MCAPLRSARPLLLLALLAGLPGTAALAQDDPDAPRSCVPASAIDRTKVVDDHSILFYMRDDTVLQNHLATNCPGLRREGRFTYGVQSDRLCANSMIAIITDMGGRLLPTTLCKLGLFVPIGEEEAADVLEAAAASRGRSRRRGNAVLQVEPVELPAEQEDETPPGAEAAAPRDEALRQ